jgi:hypothetical protein
MRYPVPPDNMTRIICSTHIEGTKLSHYYIECGKNKVEVIHVPPFSIINNSDTPDISDIYPLNINSLAGISTQKKACRVPRFKIGDPVKLADRVKLFVLFS